MPCSVCISLEPSCLCGWCPRCWTFLATAFSPRALHDLPVGRFVDERATDAVKHLRRCRCFKVCVACIVTWCRDTAQLGLCRFARQARRGSPDRKAALLQVLLLHFSEVDNVAAPDVPTVIRTLCIVRPCPRLVGGRRPLTFSQSQKP